MGVGANEGTGGISIEVGEVSIRRFGRLERRDDVPPSESERNGEIVSFSGEKDTFLEPPSGTEGPPSGAKKCGELNGVASGGNRSSSRDGWRSSPN